MNRNGMLRAGAGALAVGLAVGLGAGVEPSQADRVRLLERPPTVVLERAIETHLERVERRRERRREARMEAIPRPSGLGVSEATLAAIAACESGGDPTAVNPAGYYGKYQFDLATWRSVGGSGNPAEAPEAEQDYRAALLYQRAGASPWPVCGA